MIRKDILVLRRFKRFCDQTIGLGIDFTLLIYCHILTKPHNFDFRFFKIEFLSLSVLKVLIP